MNLRQGQEVRDAADPNRIGIVVGTGSSLGARVLWCWDESLSWTSERPVVPSARTPDNDVLTDPRPLAVSGKDRVLSDAVAQAAKRAYWPRVGDAYRQAVKDDCKTKGATRCDNP